MSHMQTPEELADEAMRKVGHGPDKNGYGEAYTMRPATAHRVVLWALKVDRAQRTQISREAAQVIHLGIEFVLKQAQSGSVLSDTVRGNLTRPLELAAALLNASPTEPARDTDWIGSRPVLMRKGDIIVVGTRMGPWGGVFVSDPEKVMGLPKELPSGLHTNDYRPKVGLAELPDATWASLGWTITEAR